MRKIVVLIIIMISVISCKKETTYKGFTLRGKLKNVADSSLVILRVSDEIIDSSYLNNGNFKFVGKVKKPTSAIIWLKNTSDYRSFWLENTEIYFTAEKESFNNGKFTVLKPEKQNKQLMSRLK